MMTTVRDNSARRRFELEVDGALAYASYTRADGLLTVQHTEVPSALNGRGIGSALVREVLDFARAQGLKVVPRCPFVRVYIERHPEYADLLHTT